MALRRWQIDLFGVYMGVCACRCSENVKSDQPVKDKLRVFSTHQLACLGTSEGVAAGPEGPVLVAKEVVAKREREGPVARRERPAVRTAQAGTVSSLGRQS